MPRAQGTKQRQKVISNDVFPGLRDTYCVTEPIKNTTIEQSGHTGSCTFCATLDTVEICEQGQTSYPVSSRYSTITRPAIRLTPRLSGRHLNSQERGPTVTGCSNGNQPLPYIKMINLLRQDMYECQRKKRNERKKQRRKGTLF